MRQPSTPAIAALAITALLSLPAMAKPAQTAPPIAALKALASGKGDCNKLVASYTDGSGFHGYTRIKVREAKIAVEHTSRRHRKVLRYTGTLSAAECRALAKQAVAHELWTVKSKRKMGVPDETRPTITIAVGKQRFSVTIWANEVHQQKAFGTVAGLLIGLAKRVSQGTVTY